MLEPSHVVFLEVDPSMAFVRKGQFTQGEIGQHQRNGNAEGSGFVAYQTKMAEVYRGLAQERKWPAIQPGSSTPEELAATVIQSLGLLS